MNTLKKLCDAISLLLAGITIMAFLTLAFFANGGSITLPFGGSPKELVPLAEPLTKAQRHARSEAKARQMFVDMDNAYHGDTFSVVEK